METGFVEEWVEWVVDRLGKIMVYFRAKRRRRACVVRVSEIRLIASRGDFI